MIVRQPAWKIAPKIVPLGLLALSGCTGVLDPQGPVGQGNRIILLDSLAIMLCIVVPTILGTLGFAWWYRAGNPKAKRLPEFIYSGRVELLVWSVPVLIVLFLSGIAWIGSHQLDPGNPAATATPDRARPVEIQVVALDWKWLFIYPEQNIATVNQLTIPVGVPIHFSITSASVMNAFFVPQLGSMIYAMNGMQTGLYLRADKPGRYYGRSAHFSGDGFPGMQFYVAAVPRDRFGPWVAGIKGKGEALDARRYWQLAQQSADVPPMQFGGVESGLFQAVVSQKIDQGPGPQRGEPGPQIKPATVSSTGSPVRVR